MKTMRTSTLISSKGYIACGTYFGYNKIITIYDKSLQIGTRLASNTFERDDVLPVITIKNITHLNDDIVILEVNERFPLKSTLSFDFVQFENNTIISDLSCLDSVYGDRIVCIIEVTNNIPLVTESTFLPISGEPIYKNIEEYEHINSDIHIIGFCKNSERGEVFVVTPDIKHFYHGGHLADVSFNIKNMFKYEMPRMSAIQRNHMFHRVIRDYEHHPDIAEGLFAHTYFSIEELAKIWEDYKQYRYIIAKRYRLMLKLKLILKIFLKPSYFPPNGDYLGGFFFRCARARFENQSLVRVAAPPSPRD